MNQNTDSYLSQTRTGQKLFIPLETVMSVFDTESKIFSGCCCTNKIFKDNGTISHGWINFTKKIKKELIIVFQVLSFPSLALLES